MASDKLKVILLYSRLILSYGLTLLIQRIQAIAHKYSYKAVSSPLNVVVIGGSFTGVQLARRLTESLPTGYRVVLIEKNSHFKHLFNFPRYSVTGNEKKAFIPYTGLGKNAPEGIFEQVYDLAVSVNAKDNVVELASGKTVKFEYLAIATGSKLPYPANVKSSEKERGAAELRSMQEAINSNQRIALVGGGAVGVQLASDVKSYYPEKEVTLIQSREVLLPAFGRRLHEHVSSKLSEMGIKLRLGERPVLPPTGSVEKTTSLEFKDGGFEEFDLVIPCTGQTPNSSIVGNLGLDVLAKSGRIHVKPTLQLMDPAYSHIFALGDVAETGGPKMARAGMMQSDVAVSNILSMIKGRTASKHYQPHFVEGSLALSLGRNESVMYVQENDEKDYLIPAKGKGDDLEVMRMWKHLGADPKDFDV
ncbi:putative amid-like NADH oxidoreductase [Acephala macrosclerotiorum]|nr:putative amid-like NADH oxidoreductase [Acephala macrosclerotiorum]